MGRRVVAGGCRTEHAEHTAQPAAYAEGSGEVRRSPSEGGNAGAAVPRGDFLPRDPCRLKYSERSSAPDRCRHKVAASRREPPIFATDVMNHELELGCVAD